jgi:hypothetical protein
MPDDFVLKSSGVAREILAHKIVGNDFGQLQLTRRAKPMDGLRSSWICWHFAGSRRPVAGDGTSLYRFVT